jgi:predicted cobalt transporter CbtA
MELTAEERAAVEKGDVLKFMIPDSRVPCILVREDLLDPLRVRADYSACNPDDFSALTAEVLDDEDWTPPDGHAARPST